MQWTATNLWWIILVAAGVHLIVYMILFWWRRNIVRSLKSFLHSLLGKYEGTSDLIPTADVDDQIEAFLQDLRAVMSTDYYKRNRVDIARRILNKQENWASYRSKRFETVYNVCRTFVEVYPILGIFGTVLALGVSVEQQRSTDAMPTQPPAVVETEVAENGVDEALSERGQDIVENFGAAIWSTISGLAAAMILMMINATFEPSFVRLIEAKAAVRDAVRQAERELTRDFPIPPPSGVPPATETSD